VKDIFGQDEALSELSASIGQLRRRLMLSDWGGLLPLVCPPIIRTFYRPVIE
jgi:hypothetical protein